jgi:hypothetical protein
VGEKVSFGQKVRFVFSTYGECFSLSLSFICFSAELDKDGGCQYHLPYGKYAFYTFYTFFFYTNVLCATIAIYHTGNGYLQAEARGLKCRMEL